jgi:hypothetical protein
MGFTEKELEQMEKDFRKKRYKCSTTKCLPAKIYEFYSRNHFNWKCLAYQQGDER